MTDETTPQDSAAMSPASAGSVAERPLGDPETAVEILKLRVAELEQAIRRFADQDATLSVQGGNVIVEMTEEKVVRLPSTFTAQNVGGWVIVALADSLNAAGVKWEVAEE